ncbi:transmembrane channel-like protein 7 isoform X2 [Misgurnus anguillicaudatus]|uniref:transmembrane channel-like protein 7 isoform X2 n=1 Tax=Misgurnus anguillicaudatus TaxID=75329 RepID=UPI003CCF4E24
MELREFHNQVFPPPDYGSPYDSQQSLRVRTLPAEDTDYGSPYDSQQSLRVRTLPAQDTDYGIPYDSQQSLRVRTLPVTDYGSPYDSQQSLRLRTLPAKGTDNDSPYDSQQSLRSRTLPAQDTGGVQFDWAPTPAEEDAKEPEPQKLRELPLHMGLKRAVWQVQKMKIPVVSRWGSWSIKHSKSFRHFCEIAKEVLSYLVLWRKGIQKIGGHFGGGVQSYFLFLRFLVILNFLSFLLIAAFVLIPSIVFRSTNFNSTTNLTGVEECLQYDPKPDPLAVFITYFLDLVSGTGFMEYSYLFYGYYNNTMVVSEGFSYNIPLAYLLTAAFYFIFCLICMIVRMGSVARAVVAAGGGAVGNYSMLVFTGWDHGLQGDRATKLKQNNLRYQLQVDLEEESLKRKAASLTLNQAISLYTFRVFLNLVVLALIGAAFYAIALATQFSQSNATTGFEGLLLQYLPSIVITTSNFVVPFLCDKIALLEKHTPSTTVILALLRAVFLRLVSLGVLLYTLWEQITCSGDISSANSNCTICSYNYNQYKCWETRVGQEMYKLTLFDFLITIATLILVEFPRRIMVDHCSCKLTQWVGRQEFLVPPNVLALVYSQTVVWTGALFSPLLPLINTIKFLLFFYCKKITLFQNCRPALRTFRSTSSNFFFLLVLLFGWMLASVVLLYSVAKIHPSYGCGPFRLSQSMWQVVPEAVNMLTSTSKEFLFYIGSQRFSIPLFLFSCVLLCYVGALTSVHGKSVELLKSQCKLEQRDKQFLVRQIEELNAKMQKEQRVAQQQQRDTERFNQTERQSTGYNNYAFHPDDDPRPY